MILCTISCKFSVLFSSNWAILRTRTPHCELFACKECDKVFTKNEALEAHKQRHPANDVIKKHRCNFCSYSTKYSSHLRKHIFTHTGERPYKCNECTAGFTQNSLLRKHMLKHAVKQIVHKCDRCFETFEDKKALEKHAKIHKKKYRCFYCSKRFSKSSSLLKHEKKHSQDDSSESDKEEIVPQSEAKSMSGTKNTAILPQDTPTISAQETFTELEDVSGPRSPKHVEENTATLSKDVILKETEQHPLSFEEIPSTIEDNEGYEVVRCLSRSSEKSRTLTSTESSSTHWKKKKMSSQIKNWSPARETVENPNNFLKKVSDGNKSTLSELALNLSKKEDRHGKC